MTKLYHDFRQILNGMVPIDNGIKYRMICVGVAMVHLSFTIAFGLSHIMLLFWYNMAATMLYMYHGFVSIRKERYLFVYITSGIEILFHVVLATLMLGWDWGFAIYTMALIPIAFYFNYTLPERKGRISFPIISSSIVGVCYVLTRVVCQRMNPIYQGTYPDSMRTAFYYYNVIIAFVMLVLFSTFFALEVRYMQRRLEQENRRLGKIANYDPLTHLLNRRSMNVELNSVFEKASQNEQSFCVMLADVDNFKKVNDTYGHDCGDEVLIAIADAISRDVRDEDAVCRWGGEEILILIKSDLETSKQIAERICQDISNTVVSYKDVKVSVTVTIGISAYKQEKSIRTMIEEADRNLYRGKKNGKNQYVS